MNEKLGLVEQQLLITENRQQQNTDNIFLLVKNCDIMFKILHKIKPFGPMSSPETTDVMLIFLLAFFLWPRNYYNDNNEKKVKSNETWLVSRPRFQDTK